MSDSATATATHAPSAQQSASKFTNKQRTIALVIVAFGFIMDLLDNTIVNVAIPTIQTGLHASYATIQWLIAGYSLSFALLLITGGRMGDVYGYKKLFMLGVGGFTVASLLCGLAPNPGILITARLLQGAMAALMVPQVFSLMQVMYKPEERGAINGLFGALGGAAASLGPVIGGLLIKANLFNSTWRPLFLINIPVGIFAFLAAQKYLPDGKSTHPIKLDLIGTGIIVVAMSLLIYPLIEGRQFDWPIWTYIMMAAAIPVFVLFGWWQVLKQRRDGAPLVVPELFESRSFAAGLFINLTFEAVMLGFFLTSTLMLQVALGFSAIHAALTGLPIAVGIAGTMAIFGQTIIPKLGRRALLIGAVIMACGLSLTSFVYYRYGIGLHSWQLIFGQLLVGIGMGFTFGSLFGAILSGVDPKHAGSASGLLNAVQQVGGAIGVAVIGVIFFGQINHGAATSFASVEPELRANLTAQHIPAPAQASVVAQTKQCFVDRSKAKDTTIVPASCKTAERSGASPAVGKIIAKSAREANLDNFRNAYHWGTIYEVSVLVVVLALSFLLPKEMRPEAFEAA